LKNNEYLRNHSGDSAVDVVEHLNKNGENMEIPALYDLHRRVNLTMEQMNNEGSRYVFTLLFEVDNLTVFIVGIFTQGATSSTSFKRRVKQSLRLATPLFCHRQPLIKA
jgi:hypothetical protein